MTRDAFWLVQPPAPNDRALRLPEEKVFLELTGRRCQPVLGLVSPQGIGLVGQGRCRERRCRTHTGVYSPRPGTAALVGPSHITARHGSEGDGLEREDDAGRFLACPAACANRPGPALAGGEGVSGTDGASLPTGAAGGFTAGDWLGGAGALLGVAGTGAASLARFGSEGDGLEREDDAAGRFLACPAASAN
jgi:hypothetical protein